VRCCNAEREERKGRRGALTSDEPTRNGRRRWLGAGAGAALPGGRGGLGSWLGKGGTRGLAACVRRGAAACRRWWSRATERGPPGAAAPIAFAPPRPAPALQRTAPETIRGARSVWASCGPKCRAVTAQRSNSPAGFCRSRPRYPWPVRSETRVGFNAESIRGKALRTRHSLNSLSKRNIPA